MWPSLPLPRIPTCAAAPSARGKGWDVRVAKNRAAHVEVLRRDAAARGRAALLEKNHRWARHESARRVVGGPDPARLVRRRHCRRLIHRMTLRVTMVW